MRLIRYTDPAAFYAAAESFLAAHEAANCLIIGLTNVLIARADAYSDLPPYFALVYDDEGRIAAAALRTTQRPLTVSYSDDPAAVALIADDVAALDPLMPGMGGPVAVARTFAERWTTMTSAAHRIEVNERVYQCDQVTAPTGVPGRLRRATPADQDALVDYILAFDWEALRIKGELEPRVKWFNEGLDADYRALYVWDDGGAVCLIGTSGATPNGMRIGPVYTPPDKRGRGYASAATAAAAQAILDSGRTRAFLFTDLANPTSNKIYQQVGFRPVIDFDQIVFMPDPV